MKQFIKDNWFKLVIAVILIVFFIIFILLNRYSFGYTEKGFFFRCNNFSGDCEMKLFDTDSLTIKF